MLILFSPGISAALLYDQADHRVLKQLKVIFSGDVLGFSEDSLESYLEFELSEKQIETVKAAKVHDLLFVFLKLIIELFWSHG